MPTEDKLSYVLTVPHTKEPCHSHFLAIIKRDLKEESGITSENSQDVNSCIPHMILFGKKYGWRKTGWIFYNYRFIYALWNNWNLLTGVRPLNLMGNKSYLFPLHTTTYSSNNDLRKAWTKTDPSLRAKVGCFRAPWAIQVSSNLL